MSTPAVTGWDNCGSFVDERDGKEYKTVRIGDQTWMAENLNYAGPDGDIGKCYNNDPANGERYGRLYTWDEAMKVCPPGWYLPTDTEWETLVNYVGGMKKSCTQRLRLPNSDAGWKMIMKNYVDSSQTTGKRLKSIGGWNDDFDGNSGNGTDDYGFAALPSGYGYGAVFNYAGRFGFWWSATEYGPSSAWFRYMFYDDDDVYRYDNDKMILFSVRCVQNRSVIY